MVWEITAEELLSRYATGERNFAGVELRHPNDRSQDEEGSIYIENADLRQINLRGANPYSVVLDRSNLTGAFLVMASLCDVILIHANLRGANLCWACLNRADLRGARLDYANLRAAQFVGTNLTGIHMEYALLSHTNLRDNIPGYHCIYGGNFIWQVTMPDGTIEEGPYYCDW